jgi:hypothetical protein
MAATLADVLKDPNYVNANAATKAAIFDKFSAKDPNYANANDATKSAIRTKFGVGESTLPPITVSAPAIAADAIPERSLAQEYAYPILETGLMAAGGIMGGAGGTVLGGPVVGTAVGGLAGGGLGYSAAKEIEKLWENYTGQRKPQSLGKESLDAAYNTLLGAAMDATGGILLPPAAKAIGWIFDKTSGKLVQIKAGKIVRELAGPQLESVKAAAINAPKDLSAAQAIAGVDAPPLQTLGTLAIENKPYVYRPSLQAQEAGRMSSIEGVTPNKAVAETARAAGSEPFYDVSSKTIVPIDPDLKTLFNRLPKGTINAAKELAKRDGRPFIFGETVPGIETATRVGGTPQITGESLQYIKRALSDIANAAPSTAGAGRDAQNAARGVLTDFISAVETRIPAYAQARQAYRVGSEPVNQSVVLNQMRKILSTPEGKESAKPFLNSLGKGEQALLKKATGFARYEEGDLAKVLTPEQMNTVTDIANQLVRNANMAEQSKAGTTMFKNVINENLKGYEIPNILDPKVAVTNKTLSILRDRVNKQTIQTLSEGMKSGQTLAKLLDTLPLSERNLVLKALIKDPRAANIIMPGVNSLIETENRNALAQ